MNKLEFSDINRYFVSVGAIFIAISFLLPYFYLKENFGIILTETTLKTYTKASKEIVLNKQKNIIFFQNILIFVSAGFLILGIAFSIIGISRWIKRQEKIDRKFDKELEKLEIEITQMTPQEKEEKIDSEIEETNETTNNTNSDTRSLYIDIENTLISKFKSILQNKYLVSPNVKIKDKFYDILLQSNDRNVSDKIVEIRYFNQNLHLGVLKQVINKLDYNLTYYKTSTDKSVNGILLFVYNDVNITEERIENMKNKIDNTISLNLINKVSIEFIKHSELQNHEVIKYYRN